MKTTILAKILTVTLFLSLLINYPGIGFALEISPRTINLGDITKGKPITQEILIANNESQAVNLKRARSSCDCITLEYEKDILVKENQIYTIILKLNTAELAEGKLKKFVFLYFENAKNPIYSIELRGNIRDF
ncbi:MAG: DUF1573 domain-containing protein [Candidatus Omnitrophica bacterium]|nr:DUF1573 domain-containing protein [Candidatus Omnitrophota bacterium]